MQTVQLAIADAPVAAALCEVLTRNGPWLVEVVKVPDPRPNCVTVLDEETLNLVGLPLPYPERVVLITRKDPQYLSRAWEAGIVSVVSSDDSPNTVMLAIMAAALRIPKSQAVPAASGISPNEPLSAASISPTSLHHRHRRCKNL
jgi:hypothetical protein